jgi:hypothetical protein
MGLTVFRVKCKKPGAVLLIIKEFRIPGPHQRFSLEIPIDRAPAVRRILLCPGKNL